MENTSTDPVRAYEKLNEESLLTIKERQFNISKDEQITQLSFELDKFRRYLFGSKSEKLPVQNTDISQMNCKKNGVNELEWLTDVFERIQSHKQKRPLPTLTQ